MSRAGFRWSRTCGIGSKVKWRGASLQLYTPSVTVYTLSAIRSLKDSLVSGRDVHPMSPGQHKFHFPTARNHIEDVIRVDHSVLADFFEPAAMQLDLHIRKLASVQDDFTGRNYPNDFVDDNASADLRRLQTVVINLDPVGNLMRWL